MAVLSRSVGVQTQNMFLASDVSTQTTFLNVIYSFAENLSDWVISEAFRCGRDVEKFADCIADFILLEVFMEKSLNNLTSYIEECILIDRSYCCISAEKNNYFSSSEVLKNLNNIWAKYNQSEKEHHHSCIFKNFQERFTDWQYDRDDDDNQENRSTNSSPDPLQVLEDDIIKCLQTLTDDEEELFSETSCSSHHLLNQSSEVDSGFLSSEDNFSWDRKIIQNKKSILPILNEGLENSSNFAWPEFNISRWKKQEDENSVTARQKFLKTLLIQEFKEKIERRKNRNDIEIIYDAPVGPTFKAQATKAIWSPDTFSKEEEHLSEGLSNSEKSENISYFIQNGRSIDQIDLCDGNRRNGNNVNNMEKKTENIQFVTEKSIPLNIDPSTITYCSVLNNKPINKEDTLNEKIVCVNDGIQQDTYYAIPYDRIITTKTIVKAPTYEGIGPTENGLPIGLRTAVKKEHSSEWYKTMFKSLHKCDDDQDSKVQTDGYMSDSELNRKDKSSNINVRNKTTHSNRLKEESSNKSAHFFPSAKSSLQTYNHKPWIISDYEPGFSSISNNENLYTNARFLPPLISPKPKYVYNDGYDSDSTLVRKTGKSHTLDLQEQKQWYKKIQKGGEIPLPGLCKLAVQKPQDPIVGPPPPMPANWDADHYYRIYTSQTENFPSSSVHNPVETDKTLEKNKQILQDDFRSKLDEVLLNQQGVNIRQSSVSSPNRFSSALLQHDISDSSNKVVILYDFIAQTSRELSLKKGDVVNIQRIIDKNWYEGNIDGKTGIFPISYAESVSSKSLQRLSKKYINGWARAKYNFTAKNQVELTLNKDDVVSLIREVDNNWYEGSLNGKSGIFPISYVEVISDPDCCVPKTSQLHSPSSSILSLAKNERNELDINKNNIKNVETTKIEKIIPVGESFSPTKNFTVCEYNNNKVSPYQALYAYKPQNDDELELKEGDVVYVIEKCDDGWFVGTSMRTGLFGTFPGNYIEKI